jgi:hypothetical protein
MFAIFISGSGNAALSNVDVQALLKKLVVSLQRRLIMYCSGEASPTIWSCYANISVFIDRENNQFLKK